MFKPFTAMAALAVASALLVPTVSQAAETSSMRVSYADLNLASDDGRGTLQRRMTSAAEAVCAIEDSRELALATAAGLCRSDALQRALPAYEAAVAASRRGSVTVMDAAALIISAQ